MKVRLSVREHGDEVDVVVSCEPGARWTDVREAVSCAAGLGPGQVLQIHGRTPANDLVVGRTPLVTGVLLTGAQVGGHGAERGDPSALLEVSVVSGPEAGRIFTLAYGRTTIGRSATADVPLADPTISRIHALLHVTPVGVSVQDRGSSNGTRLDDVPVGTDPLPWRPGIRLTLGASTLMLGRPREIAATVVEGGDGTRTVNRAPRIPPRPLEAEIPVPRKPSPPARRPVPLLAALLPVAVSVPVALLWSPLVLLFALTTPVLLLGNLASETRSARRQHRRDVAQYEIELAASRELLLSRLVDERTLREHEAPDAAVLAAIATAPSRRLWERRPGDADFLSLRVGTGVQASRVVEVSDGPVDRSTRPTSALAAVPVVLPLRSAGVVGIAGRRPSALALARHLLAQVATLQAPHDVRIAVLAADGARGEAWAWARWLPHLREDDGSLALAVTAPGAERLAARLVALASRRRAQQGGARDEEPAPSVVLVLDGARALRQLPGVLELLEHGRTAGVLTLCLDDSANALPAECRAVIDLIGTGAASVRCADDGQPARVVAPDLVSGAWADQLARALAPLHDAAPVVAGGLPASCSLLEVLAATDGVDPTNPDDLAFRWTSVPRSTRLLLGMTRNGPHVVDLNQAGPHVLVAGTTGSGKSELLQTLIASLAAANRPDHLAFLLVDYKGGAAFADCARLPHAIGLVTDLDGHLTQRALTLLAAEMRRREALFAEAGAKDLEEYQRLDDEGRVDATVARLVIVVDEFRVLAEELPDFVPGLVRLAAIGRSLGVHLVLATQRPGGAVGADIRANVNLRIALRVRDRADSVDVLDDPAAADLDPLRPGRALSRTASDELVEFQTARVAGRTRQRAAPVAPTARLVGWTDLFGGGDEDERSGEAPGETDLTRLVRAVTAAAVTAPGRPGPRPWLPPLPDTLPMPRPVGEPAVSAQGTRLPIGLLDDPESLVQPPFDLRAAEDGVVAVVGAPRSGRTSVLLTVAAAVARASPGAVHLYAAEPAGHALRGLEALPHTGAVVGRGEPERLARLVRRLAAEVQDRRDACATPQERPLIVVLLDGWEAVSRELEDVEQGTPVESLLQVLREGPSVGVLAVVTGDRSLLTGRVAALTGTRLLLRVADPMDAVLAGVAPKDLPAAAPPGRGILVRHGGRWEVQVFSPVDAAALAGDPTTRWEAAPDSPAPVRVAGLPSHVVERDVLAVRPRVEVPLGLGGEEVEPVGLDVQECRSLLVAGRAGSGRSTALALLARGLRRAGVPVALVAPRLRGHPHPPAGHDDLEVFDGTVDSELRSRLRTREDLVMLVDDVELVLRTPLEDVLAEHAARGGGVVLAGEPGPLAAELRGLVGDVRRARTGILLSPNGYGDGDVLGIRVARAALRPGRGYLVRRGRAEQLQLALPEAESRAGILTR